jgi:hypothetical protein
MKIFRRVGDALLALGAVIGIGSIVGYELDFIPALPPAVLKLVIYKLIFAGGIGLLVAGAFIRRLALRYTDTSARGPTFERALTSDKSVDGLREGTDARTVRSRQIEERVEREHKD